MLLETSVLLYFKTKVSKSRKKSENYGVTWK